MPPDLRLREAVYMAARRWHPEKQADAEAIEHSQAAIVLAAADGAFDYFLVDTVKRLLGFLMTGRLVAKYFVKLFGIGWQSVSQQDWLAPDAADVLRGSIPYRPYADQQPYELYVDKAQFEALLKTPLPEVKKRALVAALEKYKDKSRDDRRQFVGGLPDFAPHHITDDVWREGEKQAPLKRGRRPKSSK